MTKFEENQKGEVERLIKNVPVLSKYVLSLESHVKLRYLQKISTIGIDPTEIPSDQFNPECLPPIEQSDLFSYLVLQTSYYTNDQFKSYKSLEAYNQVVSGFVASVKGKIISEKHVVVAKVRHSQRMNDPLVDLWIIAGNDGTILSAHCLGCKAGLAESCSHVASVLFYIECWTRINGKLACTQVKCTWLLPSYVPKVSYERVKNIDFTSAKKLKEKLDNQIDEFDGTLPHQCQASGNPTSTHLPPVSVEEMDTFYKKLNNCKIKAVSLSLTDHHADQFVAKSRNVPVISDLFESSNLDLLYPELLRKCLNVNVDISVDDIDIVEKDTRKQAKCPGFFRHRAGRIGASVSGSVFHTNLAQPSQSLIKSICYPHLFKGNSTKAVKHGRKYEEHAIKAYEKAMQHKHVNFELKQCGMFINKEYPFIHATPDFLISCNCCGAGCGEVKCPILIENGDFDKYLKEKNSCLEKVNGVFKLKRTHNYYFQVQQQLFTLQDKKFCDFVVYAVDSSGNEHIVCDRIFPDKQLSINVIQKLGIFWRICVLPEILGRWYTRKCDTPTDIQNDNAICFCRSQQKDKTILCSSVDCPYREFHVACLALSDVAIPKTWYCPHCSKLPKFKHRGKKHQPIKVHQDVALDKTICICNVKAAPTDKLLECHTEGCKNGHFFHLQCLGYKQMPNNAKTTWKCLACRKENPKGIKKPTTSTSSVQAVSCLSSDSDSDNDIIITKLTTGTVDKFSGLAKLDNNDYDIISDPEGWLTCDIIQAAQVLLQALNPSVEGLQRPTLGRVRNFKVVTSEFIQILHTGGDHWVCVSSISCVPGTVNLYDSLYDDAVSQEIEDQTNDLLGGTLVDLNCVPVQQQTNGSDCGVFAIAFATCLALATDPCHVIFDIPKMRPYLIACLKGGKLSMFPNL